MSYAGNIFALNSDRTDLLNWSNELGIFYGKDKFFNTDLDFGIGYSSMIYLKRLPFDWLKIDREFIYNVHLDPDSRGIVEAILAVSRQYGLRVIAEGVEAIDHHPHHFLGIHSAQRMARP